MISGATLPDFNYSAVRANHPRSPRLRRSGATICSGAVEVHHLASISADSYREPHPVGLKAGAFFGRATAGTTP